MLTTTRPSGAATTAASSPGPSSVAAGCGRPAITPAISAELPDGGQRVPIRLRQGHLPIGGGDDGDNGSTSGTFGFRLSSLGERKRKGHAVVQAYILVQTEVGKAAAVAAEIAGITGVVSAEDVTGPYDVIVRAEADDVDQLGQLVVAKVQGVSGITRTLTCPVVNLA